MEAVSICCDVTCRRRMECAQFSRALDVNAGKVKLYYIIECKDFNGYEKG